MLVNIPVTLLAPAPDGRPGWLRDRDCPPAPGRQKTANRRFGVQPAGTAGGGPAGDHGKVAANHDKRGQECTSRQAHLTQESQ